MPYQEFYCNASTGSNLNGGSTEGPPIATYTSGDWVQSTRVFTVASGNPVTDGVTVGSYASVFADGASAPTGYIARVTAVTSTTITLSGVDLSGTAPTNGTGNRTLICGGAWRGPNGTDGFPFGFLQHTAKDGSGSPPRVNFKNNAAYVVTAGISHGSSIVRDTTFQGYATTPGDGGRAVLDGGTSGASYNLLSVATQQNHIVDFIFQNNGGSGTSNGVVASIGVIFQRCVFTGFRGSGLSISSGAIAIECEAYNNNLSNSTDRAGFSMTTGAGACFIRCVSHGNTGSNTCGFILHSNNGGFTCTMQGCIAASNGLDGIRCDAASNSKYIITGCVSYNNGRDGLRFIDNRAYYYVENCLFVDNTAFGVNQNSLSSGMPHILDSCGFHGNGSGETRNVNSSFIFNNFTLAASPFADAPNGNFRLVAAELLGTGRGSFTQIGGYSSFTVSTPDIGAAQAASGSASAIFTSSQVIGRRHYERQKMRKVPTALPVAYPAPVPMPVTYWRTRTTTVTHRKPQQLLPVPLSIIQVPVPVTTVKTRTQHTQRKTLTYIPGGTVPVPVYMPFPIVVPRTIRQREVQKSAPTLVQTYRSIPVPVPSRRIPYRRPYPQAMAARYVVSTPINQTVIVTSLRVVR